MIVCAIIMFFGIVIWLIGKLGPTVITWNTRRKATKVSTGEVGEWTGRRVDWEGNRTEDINWKFKDTEVTK